VDLFAGKILRVDLSTGEIGIDRPDIDFYRRHWAGAAQGFYYMLNELKPGVDPLGPENMLCISPGISGIPASGFCRVSIQAASPLTGGAADTLAGGFFGPELRMAGWDGIIITGRAPRPTYLWISDDKVELRDATHLWGKVTGEAEETIREELEEPRARVLIIGPAGENLVRYACVVNERKHVNGRGGTGAVMGSKNLKAVVVRGTNEIPLADRETIRGLAQYFVKNSKTNPDNAIHQAYGTAGYVNGANEAGLLPVNNFRTRYLEGVDETISGEVMTETIGQKHKACWACANRCKSVVSTGEPYNVDPHYGGPEYETLGALGSNCGILDLAAICKANELCNKYTMDTISTGVTISWAMECFEKGLISLEDTGGIDLQFGNAEAMLQMVEAIALRQGFGDLLAEGCARAAAKLGKGSEAFAIHVKGQEFPMHDPRGKGMLGLSYAASDLGADHTRMEHDSDFDAAAPPSFRENARPLAIVDTMITPVLDVKKVAAHAQLAPLYAGCDSLGICVFVFAPVRTFKLSQVVHLLSAATGWEVSLAEIWNLGQRRDAMARVFNARQGITSEADILPPRMFEPIGPGPNEGHRVDPENLKKMVHLYYEMRNWDKETGVPGYAKLYELDLGWLAEQQEQLKGDAAV
jgi:aldehyde:ferredoxin oxidoreductase